MIKYVLACFSLLAALSVPGVIRAQNSLDSTAADTPGLSTIKPERQEKIAQKQAEIESRRQELQVSQQHRLDARCEQITARINNRISRYEANKDKWHSRFTGIRLRIQNLIGILEERGCDTTTLTADLNTLESLLEEFAAAFRLFHTSLQGTRAYVCSENDSDFATQVAQSRNELVQVKTAADNLKNFVDNSLKPHLKEVSTACQPAEEEN
jgi:chromosome segregation ATPase